MPLIQIAGVPASESVYFYHTDHLGTPQEMTNTVGTVVWATDYTPFGEVNITVNTVENNLRFAGQYYDSETGLHYNYHRYYDPKTGRYLTPDPIGLLGGINLYAYALNNPVNLIDRLGLDPKDYIYQTLYEHRPTGLHRARVYRNPIHHGGALQIIIEGLNYWIPLPNIDKYRTTVYLDKQVVKHEVFYQIHRISLFRKEITSNIISDSEEWHCPTQPFHEDISWGEQLFSYHEKTISDKEIEDSIREIKENPVVFVMKDRARKK